MRLTEVAAITGGTCLGGEAEFASVSIDSRTLASGDLFFAIPGERFDGHDFLNQVLAMGASAAVVQRPVACSLPQVQVADVRRALGQLAAAWRDRFDGRVIGVTGSNGKTTAKEMIATVLATDGSVLKTQGNLNNDLGVPLTLLKLRPEHRYAVIEMGANHGGEIAYVAGLAKPHVGLITNAGSAHLEGFGSVEGVARAKGEMITSLPVDGVSLLNADDRFFSYWQALAQGRRVISFGFSEGAAVQGLAESIRIGTGEQGFRTGFDFVYQGVRHEATIGVAGQHNVANALAAIAAGLALGLGMDRIIQGLRGVAPVSGRMQPLRADCGSLVINDTYNANPSSFKAALDVVRQLPGEPWVALGAFGELGETSAELHADIGRQARDMGVARLFATGPNADKTVQTFGAGGTYFADQDGLIGQLTSELRKDVVVLVKGSRSQRMERVVEALCRSARG
jgi:UDP-N-acetylmuramoyl-tripeptide--D-alanyl-D-alanine ligase